MTVKRTLKRIRLDKIAGVGSPCQAPATVAIIKRAPGDPNLALAKATFQQALEAQLVNEKVCDVFWDAFENQWAIRDAFRTALTDEIAAGGDGTTAAQGFTEAMQQIATLAADAARSAASTAQTDLEAAVEEAVSKWLQTKEHPMHKYTTKAALMTAVAGFAMAKSTAGEMNDIVESAVALDAVDELPANQPELAAAAKAKKNPFDPKADPEKKTMKREIAILKMDAPARSYVEGLADDAARDAFIEKSATDQAAEIAAANSSDPVIYKTKSGIEIRKSAGDAVVMLAKQNDEQAEKIAKLEAGQNGSAIEKRARDSYPNVALSRATDLLKSAAAVGEDTDTGKAILSTLATLNKGQSHLFKTLGSTEGGDDNPGDIKKARTDFDAEVRKVQERDKCGPADAMSKVRNEQPDLFKAAYPSPEDQDADA